jgi:catechol 2,3-dioxygenase-like lactoylglutathione lyase family enzyme
VKIQALGHVVRVTDLERAEHLYGGVLGLPLCARSDEGGAKMTVFTLGNHHDFAVLEVPGGEGGIPHLFSANGPATYDDTLPSLSLAVIAIPAAI